MNNIKLTKETTTKAINASGDYRNNYTSKYTSSSFDFFASMMQPSYTCRKASRIQKDDFRGFVKYR